MHILMYLVINQPMDLILFGEALDQVVFMRVDALGQIAGYTNVKRAFVFVGKDVHVIIFIHVFVLYWILAFSRNLFL